MEARRWRALERLVVRGSLPGRGAGGQVRDEDEQGRAHGHSSLPRVKPTSIPSRDRPISTRKMSEVSSSPAIPTPTSQCTASVHRSENDSPTRPASAKIDGDNMNGESWYR